MTATGVLLPDIPAGTSPPATVAALYVDPAGVYSEIPGVDLWGEERDARLYDGPHPVVAHPPCNVWCRLAKSVEGRYPHIKVGEDGRRFENALRVVEACGGVLEHPAYSLAWSHYGLLPPHSDGWVLPLPALVKLGLARPGAVCSVDQRRYRHRATKRTWLYVCGIEPEDLPQLRWGRTPRADRGGPKPEAHVGHDSKRTAPLWGKRLGTAEASATPPEFALELVRIARLARSSSMKTIGAKVSHRGRTGTILALGPTRARVLFHERHVFDGVLEQAYEQHVDLDKLF